MKDHIYTREWFQSHYNLRNEYHAVANLIDEVFRPAHVVDVGCGTALILERLRELLVDVHGIDGSAYARECAPESVQRSIEIVDLTMPNVCPPDVYDLVICTEVAEHLEAQNADQLIEHVVSRMAICGYVFFTAATPGQGGTDHVNEQPNGYWISKFEARDMHIDKMRTMYMRSQLSERCPGMNWMGRSAMVFR